MYQVHQKKNPYIEYSINRIVHKVNRLCISYFSSYYYMTHLINLSIKVSFTDTFLSILKRNGPKTSQIEDLKWEAHPSWSEVIIQVIEHLFLKGKESLQEGV